MKISNYNIFFKHKNTNLVFNSLNCTFEQCDDTFLKILDLIKKGQINKDSLNEDELKVLKKMKQDGFVIDDDFDEIEFLKFKYYRGKFSNNKLALTIAPTMACNFACPYCYEEPNQKTTMTKDVVEAIKNMVTISADHKQSLSVTWYGGEPLIAQDIIWDLSKYFIDVCAKNNVNYNASIITNGYLIDDEVIDNFIKYKISSVQITIDGPPDIHNKRRKLKGSSTPTFDTIINNARKILDAQIRLNIRVNIDKANVSRIDDLLDILSQTQLKNAHIYLGHVESAAKSREFSNSLYLTNAEFAEESLKTEKKLLKLGFNPKYYPSYPKLKSNVCCADSLNSKVIAPNGNLYKCFQDISNDFMCIGSVLGEQQKTSKNVMNHLKYMMTSVFDEKECLNCKVLPLCMGYCFSITDILGERCVRWKYNLVDTLKFKFDCAHKVSD